MNMKSVFWVQNKSADSISALRRLLLLLATAALGGLLLSACAPTSSSTASITATPQTSSTTAPAAAAVPSQAPTSSYPAIVKAEDIQTILNLQASDFESLIKSDVPSGQWTIYKPFTTDLSKMFDATLLQSVTSNGGSAGAAIVFQDQNTADPLELVSVFATLYDTPDDAKKGSTLWTQHNDADITSAYGGPGSVLINGQSITYYNLNGLKQGNAWSENFVFYNNLNLLASLGGTDTSDAGRKQMDQIGQDIDKAIIAKLMAKELGQ